MTMIDGDDYADHDDQDHDHGDCGYDDYAADVDDVR